MTNYDLGEAVAYALRAQDGDALIAGVKKAIFMELEQLDPTANIETTSYYNHSFVPDFVLTWNEGGRKPSRQVFLRPSLLSTTAGHDIASLGHQAPVLLALRSDEDQSVQTAAARDIDDSPNVLVTDVATLEDIGHQDESRPANPIRTLVRNNLMRGGRGLIVADTARRLTDRMNSAEENVDRLDDLQEIVRATFVSDAATRIERATQLLEMGLTGDLSRLQSEDEPAEAIGGKLSNAELRILLPYLLTREDVTDEPAYWAHIGSMLTLERLEAMAQELAEVDLTPLVSVNVNRWLAVRSSATHHADSHEEARFDETPSLPTLSDEDSALPLIEEETTSAPAESYSDPHDGDDDGETLHVVMEEGVRSREQGDRVTEGLSLESTHGVWHFHAKMISIILGGWRIYVTANGRRLRGRDQSLPARWDEITNTLRDFQLAEVALDGLERRVRVTAERAADVYRDVQTIRDSISDDFSVPEISLRASAPESQGVIRVSFTNFLAVASVEVPAGELVNIAAKLLAHRSPIDENEVRSIAQGLPSALPPRITDDVAPSPDPVLGSDEPDQ